ncbi:MAG: PspC domain-containing protein [Pseudomonadales bacterium]|nr:PspC domain-containing protein [Pseudomonadales bacterium]
MSRSDRERREAEKAARRSRRLADRAELRAQRKGEQAQEAALRADRLAERANRKSENNRRPSDRYRDSSIEDLVDDVTEKWSRKASEWLDGQSQKMFDDGDSLSNGRSHRYSNSPEEKVTEEPESDTERSRRRSGYSKSSVRRTKRRVARIKSGKRRNRKRSGHGLYRDTRNSKICGVCAGSAEYLGLEIWQVRVCAVLGLIFVPSLAVPAYFITWFLMDEKPYYREATERYDLAHYTDSAISPMRKRKAENRAKTPQMSNVHALSIAKQKFSNIEEHLRDMESHVTSSQFELRREFKKIAGGE